jgi:hypothetical protein
MTDSMDVKTIDGITHLALSAGRKKNPRPKSTHRHCVEPVALLFDTSIWKRRQQSILQSLHQPADPKIRRVASVKPSIKVKHFVDAHVPKTFCTKITLYWDVE